MASYGLSGTLGPAAVAWIASTTGPLTATPALAAAAVLGGASLAGTLVAAYGAGNLLGSTGLMRWPLRGAADRLMSALTVVAATASIVDRSRPRRLRP